MGTKIGGDKMKRPERKISVMNNSGIYFVDNRLYNQACDDWEKWLPSEEELRQICRDLDSALCSGQDYASAIHKRLSGEE